MPYTIIMIYINSTNFLKLFRLPKADGNFTILVGTNTNILKML